MNLEAPVRRVISPGSPTQSMALEKPEPASPNLEVLAPVHNIGLKTDKYHCNLVTESPANTMRISTNSLLLSSYMTAEQATVH